MTATAPATPKSARFRAEREASWKELSQLCDKIERDGLRALNDRELHRLPTLHRAAVSGLSVARAISLDRDLLRYLEVLAARSHVCVHGLRSAPRSALRDFLLRDFPSAVRALAPQLALATGILLAGAITAFAIVSRDLDQYFTFLSAEMAGGRSPAASTEYLRSTLYDDGSLGDGLATFATMLFTHNAQVALWCFALGFAAGVPSAFLLFFNGLILGAMSALFHDRGLAFDWWGWVLPHGVTELLAILLAGAAGLLQGRAVLLPGRRRRVAALREVGSTAGLVMLGAVGMLFVAGAIEGFFRQLVTDPTIRYGVVLVTSVFWVLYFSRVGKQRRAA